MANISFYWEIDYINRRIYYQNDDPSAGPDKIYSVNALYSWLQDVFDNLDQMDDYIPMTAQTPTAYTLVNGWFIDDISTNYLDSGAITQANSNSDIITIDLDSDSMWGEFRVADIGQIITGNDSGATGTVLSYDNLKTKVWVRSISGTFVENEIADMGSAGEGSGYIRSVLIGTDLFVNVYTLGTVTSDPAPQVYIFQEGTAIAEWSSLTNWDRGHIDILIKVKEAGIEIDNGIITVFARQLGDLYDNFEIDLTGGGRNAVPLATATDLDNATSSYYLMYDTELNGPFVADEIVTGSTSGASAQVVEITVDFGTEGVLGLGGIKGTFVDTETISGSNSSATAAVNGTVGDTYFTYAGTDPDEVGSVITQATSGAKRVIRAYDTTNDAIVCQVDSTGVTGTNRNPYYIDFDATNLITGSGSISVTPVATSVTVVSGYSDISISFVNATATFDGGTALIMSERVTWAGGEAIVVKTSAVASGTITLANVQGIGTIADAITVTGDISGNTIDFDSVATSVHTVNQTFSGVSNLFPYDIIVECGDIYRATDFGRTVAQVYEYMKFITREDSTFQMYPVVSSVISLLDGEEYIQAFAGYSPKKASPLGTFAGGTLFGAQGIFLIGMHSDDTQAFSLIDSDGAVRNPPNYQAITVNSIENDDIVSVFESTGDGLTDVKKTQYTMISQGSGSATITIAEAIPTSTPTNGYIRVVNNTNNNEQRYPFSSWSGSVFTLDAVTTNSAYTGSDTAYVPYIDKDVGAVVTTSVTVIYTSSTDIYLVIRVRQKGFIPFQTTGTYSSTGSTTGAIRTVDTIFTA